MVVDEWARVVRHRSVAAGIYSISLEVPVIAAEAWPGQFVQLRLSDGIEPLLRMPLSIADARPDVGEIELLYECVGPKTEALSEIRIDTRLACLGPLGHGFTWPDSEHPSILVGGGIGLPPLLFLGRRLRAAGYAAVLLTGARTGEKHLPVAWLNPAASRVMQSTDDGTLGHAGLVTGLLDAELDDVAYPMVYSCGPRGMMAAVARNCRVRGIPCQVSLEEYMACGIGICAGCTVPVHRSDAGTHSAYGRYERVCVAGPVFDATIIDWDG